MRTGRSLLGMWRCAAIQLGSAVRVCVAYELNLCTGTGAGMIAIDILSWYDAHGGRGGGYEFGSGVVWLKLMRYSVYRGTGFTGNGTEIRRPTKKEKGMERERKRKEGKEKRQNPLCIVYNMLCDSAGLPIPFIAL